jgi:hypothetical protein
VLVVVIVGVVIAAIVSATLQDPKPATHDPPSPRAEVPPPPAWRPADAPVALAEPDHPSHLRVDAPLDDLGLGRRLRAAVLLVLAAVVLGSVAAGLVGGIVYLGYHLLNQALG